VIAVKIGLMVFLANERATADEFRRRLRS